MCVNALFRCLKWLLHEESQQRRGAYSCPAKGLSSKIKRTVGGGVKPLRPDDVVALANRTLEHLSVGDMQTATAILDRSHILKHARSYRDAGTTGTDSGSNHLLRETEVIVACAIVDHQQPAT